MKQLDTDTVLTIINMIDNRLRQLNVNDEDDPIFYGADNTEKMFIAFGVQEGLKHLRDHLQEYIEGLVTQAENNLNAGD